MKKESQRAWKRKSQIFIGKRHNKVCKADHKMKFELNMTRYNDAKPFHFIPL